VTLLERLRELHPEASGRSIKQWLTAGRVTVDGRVARDGRITVADGVHVRLGPAGGATDRGDEPALPAPLRKVHEDGDLLVIDKPPGLLTIATEREREHTAYRLVWDHLAARRPPGRPFIVHRLDRETSGLVVLAKTPAAKQHLQAQFAARSAEREYVAVVEGRVAGEHGTMNSRLAEDRALRVRAASSGKVAITHYRVRARRRDTTTLALTLGTGRRHQIRVQLADLGHPIVGDRAHGSRTDAFGRLALHACRLSVIHPTTGERVAFESAPPRGWV
jgi:23S rRNA pseudouridine1911/1915/1917 synthase